MSSLSKEWITEHTTDVEYKKFVLLAYLKEIRHKYEMTQLYPAFSEVISHYKNVEMLLQNSRLFLDKVPDRLQGLDYQNMQLLYEKMISSDKMMEEINALLVFAAPRFQMCIESGKEIFKMVEKLISIETVGLLPLNKNEGYWIFITGNNREKRVYEYSISPLEDPTEQQLIFTTHYRKSYYNSITDTCISIKSELIKENKNLPNPAVYAVICSKEIPFNETLLPVVKRIFV